MRILLAAGLLLFSLSPLSAQGNLSRNRYDPNSTSNPYGAGNAYDPNSINNPSGRLAAHIAQIRQTTHMRPTLQNSMIKKEIIAGG